MFIEFLTTYLGTVPVGFEIYAYLIAGVILILCLDYFWKFILTLVTMWRKR
jgi:hypothetical protein